MWLFQFENPVMEDAKILPVGKTGKDRMAEQTGHSGKKEANTQPGRSDKTMMAGMDSVS